MQATIIEIKARCKDPERIRAILLKNGADYKGNDHQTDTYFAVPHGRLKLREGKIENTLIHYHRPDQSGPKRSDVSLYRPMKNNSLKSVLSGALDLLVVVDKERQIYFIDNVKFHIDKVKTLGSFIEIEAIGERGSQGVKRLKEQCEYYLALFEIENHDLVERSYSDLLLEMNQPSDS